MSKHTQGPWTVKLKPRKWNPTMCCPESEMWAIKGPNKSHSPVAMVRVEGLGSGPSKAVRKANATLIAAAPDLLAASEAFISELDSGSDFTAWEKAKADLREAINKATGADQ